ncbi:hypothetical protein BC937DRAFT_88090 [Endogone sp. FLAS-F59071]|nr:hypothetical protein BC937DRAFT_88090 [Endogone sp. FLAS-F59071]|eukprot:RUS18998.1 hypothetical protein BC937DRAFT_88090 [Endogone sp. FLAS-F59071]
MYHGEKTDLGDPPNVLCPVFRPEPEILVESEPNVVSVETVASNADVEKGLLEGAGYSGLAGGGEAREPDGQTLRHSHALGGRRSPRARVEEKRWSHTRTLVDGSWVAVTKWRHLVELSQEYNYIRAYHLINYALVKTRTDS